MKSKGFVSIWLHPSICSLVGGHPLNTSWFLKTRFGNSLKNCVWCPVLGDGLCHFRAPSNIWWCKRSSICIQLMEIYFCRFLIFRLFPFFVHIGFFWCIDTDGSTLRSCVCRIKAKLEVSSSLFVFNGLRNHIWIMLFVIMSLPSCCTVFTFSSSDFKIISP